MEKVTGPQMTFPEKVVLRTLGLAHHPCGSLHWLQKESWAGLWPESIPLVPFSPSSHMAISAPQGGSRDLSFRGSWTQGQKDDWFSSTQGPPPHACPAEARGVKAAHEQQAVPGEPGRHSRVHTRVHSLPNKGIIRKHLADLPSSTFMTSFSSSQVTNWTGTGFCLGAKPWFDFSLLYLNSCPNII